MKKVFTYPILLVLGIFLGISGSFGQDVNFSQYFSTPLYFNPAYTGINTGVRARFSFRDQWPSAPADWKAYYFSADLGDRNLPGSGGLGLMIESDDEGFGFISSFQAALTVGVRIPLSSFMVSQLGIKAAVVQKKVNWNDLVFSDQLSEKYGNIYESTFQHPESNTRIFPDFAAGAVLQFMSPTGNVNGNVGFSVDHLFRPDEAFLTTQAAPLPRKFIAQGDVYISTGYSSSSSMSKGSAEPLKLDLGFIFQNQANLNYLQLGMNLLKYNIYLGAWYKTTMTGQTNNAVALLAGYRYSFAQDMSIKFMYSYDLQIAGTMTGTGGAHEISLVLEFDKVSLFGGGRSGGGFVPGGRSSRGGALECPSFY
jgi:type IX secretion system PorP/SprF family membrane protein